MFSAVVLHTVMVLSVMIPSLVGIYFALNFSSTILATVVVHAVVGALTWVLGVWIVASWRLRKDLKYCLPKKSFMLATYVLWLVTIALGTLLYLSLYLSVISMI